MFSCQTPNNQSINPQGKTVETRFNLPNGYQRIAVAKDSFGAYLRGFALKEDKAKVYFYNGQEKTNSQQVAVLELCHAPSQFVLIDKLNLKNWVVDKQVCRT